MYAVIKTGGKQHKVAPDDLLRVEKLEGDAGSPVIFDDVLLVGNGDEVTLGTPLVEGASVSAEVIEQTRDRKVIVFKKKRRQGYQRTRGHRQHVTIVKINEILTGGTKASRARAGNAEKAAPKPKKEPSTEDADMAAPLFDTPAGDADDLKKISGVGPVLEKKLNALGITRFDQVAGFSADDIARVDDRLNFKGRIERDEWISQARALAAGGDA